MITNLQNTNSYSFTSRANGRHFRKEAHKLIKMYKNDPELGSLKYERNSDRYFYAIYELARRIGKRNVTPEDRRLHKKLKEIYAINETILDSYDVGVPGAHYVDRTINYSI